MRTKRYASLCKVSLGLVYANLFCSTVVAGQGMFERVLGARVLDRSVAEVALEGRKPILEFEILFLGAGDAVADEVVLASEMIKTN
jgi:hypothetical protein